MSQFMPHGHCFLWRADLLFLHVLSDGVIALSYFTIPLAIFYFIRKKKVRNRLIPALFIAFILSCGLTHLIGIWNFWNAHYWMSGGIKMATAGISAFTAAFLWISMPRALKLPTAGEVADLNDQLQEANRDLEGKVHKRTEELHILNKDLEHVLSMLSHDFRNGLNLIQGYTDLLSTSKSSEEVQNYTGKLREAGMRLTSMVSDLTDIGRLKNLNFSKVDLNVLVDSTISELAPLLTSAQASCEVKGLPVVMGVESLLHQLFFNLLSNSIKYKRPDQPLNIKVHLVEEDENQIVIHFEDNGIGISESEAEKIFDLYTRGSMARQSNIPGSGVGLSFCRKICEIHDGDIVWQSGGAERTVFKIRLAKQAKS